MRYVDRQFKVNSTHPQLGGQHGHPVQAQRVGPGWQKGPTNPRIEKDKITIPSVCTRDTCVYCLRPTPLMTDKVCNPFAHHLRAMWCSSAHPNVPKSKHELGCSSRRALGGSGGSCCGALVLLSSCWIMIYSWPSRGWVVITVFDIFYQFTSCTPQDNLDALPEKVKRVVGVLGIVCTWLKYVHDEGPVWVVGPPAAQQYEQEHRDGGEQARTPVGWYCAGVSLHGLGCVVVP